MPFILFQNCVIYILFFKKSIFMHICQMTIRIIIWSVLSRSYFIIKEWVKEKDSDMTLTLIIVLTLEHRDWEVIVRVLFHLLEQSSRLLVWSRNY